MLTSSIKSRIVGHSYLQCIPVVVPEIDAVQYFVHLELQFCDHVLSAWILRKEEVVYFSALFIQSCWMTAHPGDGVMG